MVVISRECEASFVLAPLQVLAGFELNRLPRNGEASRTHARANQRFARRVCLKFGADLFAARNWRTMPTTANASTPATFGVAILISALGFCCAACCRSTDRRSGSSARGSSCSSSNSGIGPYLTRGGDFSNRTREFRNEKIMRHDLVRRAGRRPKRTVVGRGRDRSRIDAGRDGFRPPI